LGGLVPAPFKALAALALDARGKGVTIHRPAPDPAMAEAYRGARVHLYPGDGREVYCHSLAESQACGTPGVARPFPATAECILADATGRLAPDENGFARATLSLLKDDGVYTRLGTSARERAKARTWDAAATAFEAIWR
jgi:glycosyltransferase involved in cell wall biosynthesis